MITDFIKIRFEIVTFPASSISKISKSVLSMQPAGLLPEFRISANQYSLMPLIFCLAVSQLKASQVDPYWSTGPAS